MAETEHVRDVDAGDFEQAVLAESRMRPVVVDFWATWCAPCRFLTPVLEKLAEEFGGEFLLAKINADSNPEIADEFHVRSIPNVKVFMNGRVVDELLGAVPEDQARNFLRRHCPTAADRKFAEAREQLNAGSPEKARALLTEALKLDGSHASALIEMGKLMASDGNSNEAVAHWDRVPASSALWDHAQALKQSLRLQMECRSHGGPARCSRVAEEEPENLEARFAHGCCLASEGEYRQAFEEFLFVIRRDRNFRDESARKAMLTVFLLAGERSALTEEYRKKLALVLF